MELRFLGAAQTVTGSMHLLRASGGSILLDCGLYQGRRRESAERNRNLPVSPKEVDAVVLSHAHIDHIGALPILFKHGYRGPVFCTPATRDLCAVMLRDAAHIQSADARFLRKQAARSGESTDDIIDPLYEEHDVLEALRHFISIPYHHKANLPGGVDLTFLDAGHVLGSAISLLDSVGHGRICFTGDLGRGNMPILRDPEIPKNVTTLVMESTYGDRLHDPIEKMDGDLAAAISRTIKRGGKVLIPTFALERAQEVLYALKTLFKNRSIPRVPVYIDSPLAARVTDIFRLHPECYDDDARAQIHAHESPFDFDMLAHLDEASESKVVSASETPAIVLAGSGMCEAGRILHHLRNGIESDKNTVIIVGYQAQHTLGRRLVEKRQRVKILGVERERRAEIVVLNGFSAHADQRDLLAFAQSCRRHGPVQTTALVHGDLAPQKALAAKLTEAGLNNIIIPAQGDTLRIQ